MAGSIPLRLQDTKQAAWADGKRDIFLVIYKQPGAELRELVGHDPVRPRVSSQKPNLIAANGPILPLLIAEAAVPASVLFVVAVEHAIAERRRNQLGPVVANRAERLAGSAVAEARRCLLRALTNHLSSIG